ncbi:MAG: hypothetical protein CMJ90_11875 [Planctomycetes bacterium]|nr:hypothetical protein [Planctomycetota bacterium]
MGLNRGSETLTWAQMSDSATCKWARAAFTCAATACLLVSLASTIKATGAVPGDEFFAAGVLYEALPALILVARVLAAVAAVALLLDLRASRGIRPRLPTGLAAITIAIAPWAAAPWCVLVGTAALATGGLGRIRQDLLEASGDRAERLETLGQALGATSGPTLLRWWGVLSLLTAAAALLVSLAESWAYTAGFAPELFPVAALLPYRWHLAELAAHFGPGLGLAYLVPVLIVRLLARRRRRTALLALAAVTGGTMFVYIGAATFAHVGDEIIETGCLPHTVAFLMLLLVYWSYTVYAAFLALGFNTPGDARPSAPRIWAVAATAPLLPPLTWLGRLTARLGGRPSTYFALVAVAAALWLFALVKTSYPDLEDFRSQFIVIGVITAVHVLVLGLAGLCLAVGRSAPKAPRGLLVGGLLALLLLLISGTRSERGESALILNEYSRFGYVVKKTSIRELLTWDRLGTRPTKTVFRAHGPGEDRYPTSVPEPLEGRRPPIVFVLWDAARPDRMGCYGHPRETSPNADALARESVVFERAYSMSTATSCGVRHIMTGRYSTRYMLERAHDPFFVHALRQKGYDRVLVTAFGSDFNGVSIEAFKRGGPAPETDGARFEHLTRHPRGLDREVPEPTKCERMIEAWRRVHAERGSLDGTFSWLHFTGAHFPWFNRDPVKDFGDGYKDLYDGELAKVDALTGRAFDTLKELGAWDDAIIVLLADHGTGLSEHGRWAGFLPYEEQIRIPLIVKMPGITQRRVDTPVGTIDLAPTLLGLFEPGGQNTYDGVSLLPLLDGTSAKLGRRHIVSLCAFEDGYALIEDGRWKLHYHRAEGYALLFDLDEDPGERRNQFNERSDVAGRLVGLLDGWLWEGRRGYGNPYHYRDWTPPR